MSDKAAKIIIPIVLTCITAASYFLKDTFNFLYDALKNIFSFKFSEKEKQILFKYLELKYQELKNGLTNLSINLIKDKEFMKKLSEKIRNLYSSKNIDINKALSEQKKIYILGETGVGKSTLINCLEEEQLAREAKISVPTTLEYKEYISKK